MFELINGDLDAGWRLAGEPIDSTAVGMELTRQGDRCVLDLVDRATGAGIHNVLSWSDDEGQRRAVVPLRDIWVYASAGTLGELQTRQLADGRTVVQIPEDDGSVRHLTIDNNGHSSRLSGAEVPAAAFRGAIASIGIGLRRESELGPHLGRGVGGKWDLSGDVEADRQRVGDALERLLEQARAGRLDHLLSTEPRAAVSHNARSSALDRLRASTPRSGAMREGQWACRNFGDGSRSPRRQVACG